MESIKQEVEKYVIELLMKCGDKYGFSGEEAVREFVYSGSGSGVMEKEVLKVSPVVKEKVVKEKVVKEVKGKGMVFPFSGVKWEGCCEAIKQNHGLYSQCMNEPMNGKNVCKMCDKKNVEYGYIEDRIEKGDSWCDPKGVKPTHYRKIIRYLKLTDEEIKKAALEKNIYIGENHFEELEVKKGRTKKVVEKVEEEDKKRGRPKKEEKKVEVSATEDLFATLVKEAEEAKVEAKVEANVVEEEEEEEITVKKFEHKGVTYLRSSDNVMYDMNTEDAIGKWNEVTKSIDAYELEPEEEEEE
jgi:hypothetical protein